MCAFEEDFKQAIENLQEERKSRGKRPYDVHYTTPGTDPEVLIRARIQGGCSGRSVEVYITARGCKVMIPETDIQKNLKKSELNLIIDCIKDLLETPIRSR